MRSALVIAAYNKYVIRELRKFVEKSVKQLDGIRRRLRFVVNVAGYEHGIGSLGPRNIYKLSEYISLIVRHPKTVYGFAEMKIGNVHKFHIFLLDIIIS